MALYRLHRKEWEKTFNQHSHLQFTKQKSKKRKRKDEEIGGGSREEISARGKLITTSTKKAHMNVNEGATMGSGGRKGISSGLSTVIKWHDGSKRQNLDRSIKVHEEEWWSTLNT
jgi:hypothetical protein